jgi:hypothetical protein
MLTSEPTWSSLKQLNPSLEAAISFAAVAAEITYFGGRLALELANKVGSVSLTQTALCNLGVNS